MCVCAIELWNHHTDDVMRNLYEERKTQITSKQEHLAYGWKSKRTADL